ncbi:MAG: LamG-like jellyroll fold domain-containing protein [Myxococcales bacterium]
MSHQWRPKPIRPALNRAHGLCSGLIFASAPGWTNGRGQGASPIGEVEDVRNIRGVWNAAVNNHTPWEGGLGWGGRSLDNGDGSFVSAPEFLVTAAETRWDLTANMSAAVLVRPDTLSTDATIPIFKRRNQPYGATEAGWHFSGKAGPSWRFAFSDGVTERSVGALTLQDVTRADLLIVLATPTQLRIYINGVLEGSPAFAATAIGNPSATPIKFLGLGTAAASQPNYAGQVGVGYVWDRLLTQGEINALAADPFTPYRATPFDEELGAAQLAGLPDDDMGAQALLNMPDLDDAASAELQTYLLSL